jgi:hypothetical protein
LRGRSTRGSPTRSSPPTTRARRSRSRSTTATSRIRWAGLFLEQYQQADPTYVDLRLSVGIDTNPSGTATVGDLVEAGFTVRNDGDHMAHLKSLDASVTGPGGEDLDFLFASDGTAANLASGATQTYLAQAAPFGTPAGDSGTYEVVAWYQSSQGEWFAVPPGAPGTSPSTTVDAS